MGGEKVVLQRKVTDLLQCFPLTFVVQGRENTTELCTKVSMYGSASWVTGRSTHVHCSY